MISAGVAPSKPISLIAVDANTKDEQRLSEFAPYLRFLAKVEGIELASADPAEAAVAVVGGNLKLFLPMAGLIDFEAEKGLQSRLCLGSALPCLGGPCPREVLKDTGKCDAHGVVGVS